MEFYKELYDEACRIADSNYNKCIGWIIFSVFEFGIILGILLF